MRTVQQTVNLLMGASLLAAALMMCWAMTAEAQVIIPPETISQRVVNYINNSTELDDEQARLKVEIIRSFHKNVTLEGEDLAFEFEDNRISAIPHRTIVKVTMATDQEVKTIGVPVRVKVEKPVWVTKRSIRAKETIEPDDVVLQMRALDHQADYVLDDKADVASYSSRVNLPPGQLLDIRKLKLTPLVHRNDRVHIQLKMPGTVNVTVIGEALEEGGKGERIKVKHKLGDRRTKIYNAMVVGRNKVMVNL